ncbi:hypothetical protein, partial [Kitasatospora cystarginea]|uniref:hypothetical protein n=1 Tax=Kitasatospora cystarginea TaxID=58350 RepID=UPI0031D09E9B
IDTPNPTPPGRPWTPFPGPNHSIQRPAKYGPSLSITEHRVLELVSAGRSDRQVAQALLLTPQDVTAIVERVGRAPG